MLESIERQLITNCLKDLPGRQNYEDEIITLYVNHSSNSHSIEFWQNILTLGNKNLEKSCFDLIKVDYNLPLKTYEKLANHLMNKVNLENPEIRIICYRFLCKILDKNTENLSSSDYEFIDNILKWVLAKKGENLYKCEEYFFLLEKVYTLLLRKKVILAFQ